MDALERDYVIKRTEYDRLIALNDPDKLPRIRQLNTELSGILEIVGVVDVVVVAGVDSLDAIGFDTSVLGVINDVGIFGI